MVPPQEKPGLLAVTPWEMSGVALGRGAVRHRRQPRWYDARIGRFVSEDPIGFGGGDVTLYSYVKSDPVNYWDPLGTQAGRRPPIEPASQPPSAWDNFRDWFVYVWYTGIPFRIGLGQSTTGTPMPGVSEACGALQVAPELYRNLSLAGEKNAAYYDAVRCSQGDCTPRANASWQDGLGPWSKSGYSTGYDQNANGQER